MRDTSWPTEQHKENYQFAKVLMLLDWIFHLSEDLLILTRVSYSSVLRSDSSNFPN